MRLASAPVTWGVWERTVGRDDLVPPELLLETMRGLAYTATELGPPGYFSPQLLERYEMALVGGFAPLRFEDDTGFREDVDTWLRSSRLASSYRSRASRTEEISDTSETATSHQLS